MTVKFRYLGDKSDGGVLAAGAAVGVGYGAQFAGAVLADRVDADDLAVLGQLDGSGDDGDVGEGPGPGPAGLEDERWNYYHLFGM